MVTTREQLLDAAYDAALAGDWDRVRMADVARIAGADAAIVGHEGTPAEAIAAATVWTLEEAARNPLLKAVLTDDVGGLLPYLTTRGESLHKGAREHLVEHLHADWPAIPADRLALVADTVTRLTFSHLVLPGGRPEEVARDIAVLVESLLGAHP